MGSTAAAGNGSGLCGIRKQDDFLKIVLFAGNVPAKNWKVVLFFDCISQLHML